jgi:hypothetical protein
MNKGTRIMKHVKQAEIDIARKTTQFFHCMGTTVSGWKSCAVALQRCQVEDKRQFGACWPWADYPSDRWGWITDTGRCIGAGEKPTTAHLVKRDELLIAVPLPFEGSGRELRIHAEKFVKQMNRAFNKAK